MREFKSFLATVEGNEGSKCHYPTRLDTYGCGCAHNCNYCYARSLLDFRGLWNPNDPAVADKEKVKAAVRKLERGSVVRLGGMTDCFQPAEREYLATYEAIKALNKQGVHYLIVTKSALIADELYTSLMDKELAHIQISVTSTSDDANPLGENASKPSERIAAIERLHGLGFDVALRLSPLIPEFIDFDIVNDIEVEKCLVEFLRVNSWIAKWLDIDLKPYSHKEGGYRHLPRPAKQRILEKITLPQVSVCEDCQSHYDFWRYWFNPNPDDCCNLAL